MFAKEVRLTLRKIGFGMCIQEKPVTVYSFSTAVEQIIASLEI